MQIVWSILCLKSLFWRGIYGVRVANGFAGNIRHLLVDG